ncbi:hypothetical protein L6452_14770 [Arctium lappa]|uniref:Uncharacterized protein n=1 Tax=Arctium lappa TaxID=4217 RepID=A0ACB9CLU7_ARCLA|nr:hypothetical protein L6452_14770 [Arctium lappa]
MASSTIAFSSGQNLGHSPPSRIAGDIRFCTEVDLAITADLQRLPVERHGVGSHFFLVWKQRRWDYCGGAPMKPASMRSEASLNEVPSLLRGCALKRVACWLEAVKAGSLCFLFIFESTRLDTCGLMISSIKGVKPASMRFPAEGVCFEKGCLRHWKRDNIQVLHGGCLFSVKEADLAITADLQRLHVEHHGVGSKGVGTCFQVLRQIWMKAFELLRRVEMGLIRTFLGFSGFGIGVSAGLVIGCYLFIYFQPTDVKDPIIRPLVERDSETFQSLLPEKPLWVITQILTGYVFRDYNVAKPIIAEQIPKYEF